MNKNDFPIFTTYPELVYLDSAATSQKPQMVIDALTDFYTKTNSNVHRGLYKLSEAATQTYEAARQTTADFVGAKAEEIIFTSGTTQGINMVALGFGPQVIKADEIILSTLMEHHSNILPWQLLAKNSGAKIDYVSLTPDFRLDLADLEKKLTGGKVRFFALTHMSNVLGTINPVKEIISLVRRLSPETIIAVDAAQSVPHFKVDVKDLDVDFLTFSGHKMFGPTGIGVLYGKQENLEFFEPYFRGGGMIKKVERESATWEDLPAKFEAGTPDIAGAIGLAAAIKYIQSLGWEKIISHETELLNYALEKLREVPGLSLFGPATSEGRGGVISINLENIHAHDLAQILDESNVAVRAGHHCNQLLMREVLDIPATARISLHIYNTNEDIDRLTAALKSAKDKIG